MEHRGLPRLVDLPLVTPWAAMGPLPTRALPSESGPVESPDSPPARPQRVPPSLTRVGNHPSRAMVRPVLPFLKARCRRPPHVSLPSAPPPLARQRRVTAPHGPRNLPLMLRQRPTDKTPPLPPARRGRSKVRELQLHTRKLPPDGGPPLPQHAACWAPRSPMLVPSSPRGPLPGPQPESEPAAPKLAKSSFATTQAPHPMNLTSGSRRSGTDSMVSPLAKAPQLSDHRPRNRP